LMPGIFRKITAAEAPNGPRDRIVRNAAPYNTSLKGHPCIRLEVVYSQVSVLPSEVGVFIRF
jgi:hypothetical protein